MRCPNCAIDMAAIPVDRMYGREQHLDVCRACQLVWFDHAELMQMAPGGTLQLVSLFADDTASASARPPLRTGLACPRCRRPLADVHDMQRGTRFSYARCPESHGRLLTYYQFLRAKNFVRALGSAEIDELRRHVRQVNCVNCGAAVDVGRDAVCQFCRTPIAILDPAQLRKAVDDLKRSLEQKPADATLPITMAIERMKAERAFAETPDSGRPPAVLDLFFGSASDPLVAGLRALGRVLRSG
jgi:hypothetical protein